MPTARELLEQADALMRRNRARMVDTDIPELTDAIPDAVVLPPAPTSLDEVPELADTVEEIEIASIVELPEDREMPSEWLRVERDAVVHADESTFLAATDVAEGAAAAPDQAPADAPAAAVEATAPPALGEATVPLASAEATAPLAPAEPAAPVPTFGAPAVDLGAGIAAPLAPPLPPEVVVASVSVEGAAPTPAPEWKLSAPSLAPEVPADDWARWQALAEEIRMQVLQRIDIFTDTGLREQLGAQLQPIVERASADMIATINEQVGTLLRAYIAEAIEREIEKWRRGNP